MNIKKLSFVTATAFLVAVGAPVASDLTEVRSTAFAAEVPTLTAEGFGEVKTAPDVAYVSLSVHTTAKTATVAQKENAAVAAKVIESLRSLGLSDKDIRTQNYSFNPIYENKPNRKPEIVGYAADNSVVVTINDLSLTGKVIDNALAFGANGVNSLSFAVRDSSALQKSALVAAAKDAKSKAEVMAGAVNVRLAGIQRMHESVDLPGGRVYNRMPLALKMTAEDFAEATPVEVPELTVSARVQIDFVLEN